MNSSEQMLPPKEEEEEERISCELISARPPPPHPIALLNHQHHHSRTDSRRSTMQTKTTIALLVILSSLFILNISPDFKAVSANIIQTTNKPNNKLPNREIEKQIVDKILGEGYDKRIRPSGLTTNVTGSAKEGPAVVRVNTLIRSISKIDDVTMEYSVQLTLRQEWVDERLAFSRKFPTDIKSITLTEQERLWKPDLFFRNEKEGHFHKIIMPNVLIRINGDGAVLYSIRISLVLACPMDLKYYPLDKQNCTIEMASYGYLDEDLKFLWKEKNPVQINQPLTLPRFTLETFGTAFCTSRTATGAYSCLRVDLIFKREFSYYLIQIYIPCCMLVIVSWVSFWLDPNAIPARVSLGVTTLLTMATQISGINASLPPVSYTKAIDVWTGVCLTFVFGALLEFALVNYASRSDAHARMQQARQEEELRAREMEFQHRRQLALLQQQQQQQHQHHQQQHQHNNQHHHHGYQQQAVSNYNPSSYQAARHNPHQQHLGYPAPSYGQPVEQKFQPPAQNSETRGYQPNDPGSNGAMKQAAAAVAAASAAAAAAATAAAQAANQQQQQLPNGQPRPAINNSASVAISSPTNNNNHRTTPNNSNQFTNDNQQQQQQAAADKQHLLPNGNLATTAAAYNPFKLKQSTWGIHHSILQPSSAGNGGGGGTNSKSIAEHHHLNQTNLRKKKVNFCRAWLNKFPSRSKRIDVISRIFFPKMFALFNLVYWTTYLFREDDIVQA